MTRRSSIPKSRHHIMLENDDWSYLDRCYGPQSAHPRGVGPTISFIVHNFVLKLKARTAQALDDAEQPTEGE